MTLPTTPTVGEVSQVANLIRAAKERLFFEERLQMSQMASRWSAIMNQLELQMTKLAVAIEADIASGKTITIAQTKRMEEYKILIRQAREEVELYNRYATGEITKQQLNWGLVGQRDAQEALNYYMSALNEDRRFSLIARSRVENLAGYAKDGKPLGRLLAATWPEARLQIDATLSVSIARGLNPVKTAKLFNQQFAMPLNRSLVIARTEQLRVYRFANLDSYKLSNVVSGYKRLAAHDPRTCPGCLFVEGMIIQNLNEFEEHPQGRCSMVPIVINSPIPKWDEGNAYFDTLTEGQKRLMVGNAQFELLAAGKIKTSDIPKRVANRTWGAKWVPKSIAELNAIAGVG